jgi:AraC family transcriptional regulator of adaptative response/methylated-DNA-[protein]-cysteine methyltransferase
MVDKGCLSQTTYKSRSSAIYQFPLRPQAFSKPRHQIPRPIPGCHIYNRPLLLPPMLPDPDIMYQALLNKDESFEGIFITGVKTTGIFCRPVCTAKKPLRENVEFFATAKEAILKGYRPCKVCRPLDHDSTPAYIKELVDALHEDPSVKFKDWDLRQKGIDPVMLRRWFLKHHGITFHAYQRMFRINSAFNKIREGAPVTSTALDSGYDSLSGFGESFKNIFGVAPSKAGDKQVISIARIETPLGTMLAGASKKGLSLLEFTDRKMLETELKSVAKIFNAVLVQEQNAFFELLEKELAAYFEGKLKNFKVPLDLHGTDFQVKVWQELQNIPYGKTRSYKEQSIALNNPLAIRAIAQANGMNRIAIIIPCHRVIGEDGSMTGYGGGIWRKKWLLEHESLSKQGILFSPDLEESMNN